MEASVSRNVQAGIDPVETNDLSQASSPAIDRPLFAGTIQVQTTDTEGKTFESSPYVEVRRGTGELAGTAHLDITPDQKNPQHSIMGAIHSALRGQIAKALVASGTFLGLGGIGGAEAQAGFLVNSADMAASRALGESYTGVPTAAGNGGLLGLSFTSGNIGSAVYINPYYIITAGHVTWGTDASQIGVTTGNNPYTDTIASGIESITYFPTYAGPTGDFFTPDLAIIKLSSPLSTDYIQEIGGITQNGKIVGVGFGQLGASDLGDYRELTGEASGWYGRATWNGTSLNTSDLYYNTAIMSSSVGALAGRGDLWDSGGGWYSNGVLVGMSVSANLDNNAVGGTWILDLTNPEISAFISENTVMPRANGAVPEPSSFILATIGTGAVAAIALRRRS